jgi:hypothetical protein
MKANRIAVTLVAGALGVSGALRAQSNADHPSSFTHGESKRCESLSGSAKAQCDKEEATKSEGPQAGSADAQRAGRDSSAAAGGSAGHFTHGESKRCETMTGAAKERCDKQEATK